MERIKEIVCILRSVCSLFQMKESTMSQTYSDKLTAVIVVAVVVVEVISLSLVMQ